MLEVWLHQEQGFPSFINLQQRIRDQYFQHCTNVISQSSKLEVYSKIKITLKFELYLKCIRDTQILYTLAKHTQMYMNNDN